MNFARVPGRFSGVRRREFRRSVRPGARDLVACDDFTDRGLKRIIL
jgi:hypothetical protein